MAFFDEFVADGLCCAQCGEMIDETEPGYVRTCDECKKKKRRTVKRQNTHGKRA